MEPWKVGDRCWFWFNKGWRPGVVEEVGENTVMARNAPNKGREVPLHHLAAWTGSEEAIPVDPPEELASEEAAPADPPKAGSEDSGGSEDSSEAGADEGSGGDPASTTEAPPEQFPDAVTSGPETSTIGIGAGTGGLVVEETDAVSDELEVNQVPKEEPPSGG